jgi:hypothetical protein
MNPNAQVTARVMLLPILLCLLLPMSASAAPRIPLDGTWRFALDQTDGGVRQQWFARELPFDRIKYQREIQIPQYWRDRTSLVIVPV